MSGLLILTTVGTSAIDSKKLESLQLGKEAWGRVEYELGKLPARDLSHRDWAMKKTELPGNIGAFIDSYVRQFFGMKAVDNQAIQEEIGRGKENPFPAEFTSLYLLNPEPQDRITLLLSDTHEGVTAGLINERLIQEQFAVQPRIRLIEGLQPENFSSFYKEGIEGFQEIIEDELGNHEGDRCSLNITGGFKSLVPYATYIAFAYDIDLHFVFEEQPNIMRVNLNQLDLTYEDGKKVEDAKDVIRRHGHPQGYTAHSGMDTRRGPQDQ